MELLLVSAPAVVMMAGIITDIFFKSSRIAQMFYASGLLLASAVKVVQEDYLDALMPLIILVVLYFRFYNRKGIKS